MMTVPAMDDRDAAAPSPLWRALKTLGLGMVAVFACGVVAGFAAVAFERGESLGLVTLAVLAALMAVAGAAVWMLVRSIRAGRPTEPLTRKEKLNRNLLTASGLIGGGAAVLLVLVQLATNGTAPGPLDIFSSAPLPAAVAALLVAMMIVVIPAISYVWHRRAIDEQEADAYKTGALYGLYLFMLGAPAWWFAWRGGFAPEPNGVVIYLATVAVVGAVWTWKKYR